MSDKTRHIILNKPNAEIPSINTKQNPKTNKRKGYKPPSSLFFECCRKTPVVYDCWMFENGRTVIRIKTKDQKEVLQWLKAYHEIGRKGFVAYAQHKLDFCCIGDKRIRTYQKVWRHLEVGTFSLKRTKWIKTKLDLALSAQNPSHI